MILTFADFSERVVDQLQRLSGVFDSPLEVDRSEAEAVILRGPRDGFVRLAARGRDGCCISAHVADGTMVGPPVPEQRDELGVKAAVRAIVPALLAVAVTPPKGVI